jgi:glucokinase
MPTPVPPPADTLEAAEEGLVVALDVGASQIKGALIAADGSRVAQVRQDTGRADGPDAVLRRIVAVAAELMAVPGHQPQAGGVAVCGTVDTAGLVTAVNIGLVRAPVADLLSHRLRIPITLVNDAHAGAIGEGAGGSARDVRDYLYVSLGTGIGAAIVQDGRVAAGAHGHAGELGHITLAGHSRQCACGERGCLETVMSAAALESGWRETHRSAVPADRIIDLVIARDPAAERLWLPAVDALATGLLTAISLIDPALIVLGGGLAAAGDRLIDPLLASMRAQARPFHVIEGLRLAELGSWSGCIGAAAAARQAQVAPTMAQVPAAAEG